MGKGFVAPVHAVLTMSAQMKGGHGCQRRQVRPAHFLRSRHAGGRSMTPVKRLKIHIAEGLSSSINDLKRARHRLGYEVFLGEEIGVR
eukprot:40727-Amphidinium_carterae.2